MKDKQVQKLIEKEKKRQRKGIQLIASENKTSQDVRDAVGSVMMHKYGEGYPGRRYYSGNQYTDQIERLAQERALKLFKLSPRAWHVNVQPHSGSPANLAIYIAFVPKGGKIMGMSLTSGGHLTHGQDPSFTGKFGKRWKHISYDVSRKDERIDYDELKQIARREKPNIVVAGFTAYPRKINFKKFREIADAAGALLMVDMSHIAGLVAAGVHPSPFPYADVVMTTSHKTLRGPRGAMIFVRKDMTPRAAQAKEIFNAAKAIDKAIFPGLQGGPHFHSIAGMAVALKEARSAAFQKYIRQVVANAKMLAEELKKRGWRVISGGTDTHLLLIDVWSIGGKEAQERLERNGIFVNRNTIPFETRPSPFDPSGLRIGTPFETSKGLKDVKKIAAKIDKILRIQ